MAKTKNTGALQVSDSASTMPLLPLPASDSGGCGVGEIENSSEGGSASSSDGCDSEYESDEQYEADNANEVDDENDIVFADENDDNEEYYEDRNDHNDQDVVDESDESDAESGHDDDSDSGSDSGSDSSESSESLEEIIGSPSSTTAGSSPVHSSNNQSGVRQGVSSETITTFSTSGFNPQPGGESIPASGEDGQSGNKPASDIDTVVKTGRIFYAPSTMDEKDLKGRGLTQLEISLEGNSLSLRHPGEKKPESKERSSKKLKVEEGPSKRGSSDDATQKTSPKKKGRRAENVGDMKLTHRVDIKDKTGHLDIILPDEVDILSLVVYNSSGIKNSILLPLSDARFRKLVDQTSPPTRAETREKWDRIRSE